MDRTRNNEYDTTVGKSNDSLTCNFYNSICDIKIPRGYYICHNCNGIGCFYVSVHFKQRYVLVLKCPLCNGKGYVDWIVKARGVKTDPRKGIIPQYTMRTKRISFNCKNKGCKVIKRWARKNFRG